MRPTILGYYFLYSYKYNVTQITTKKVLNKFEYFFSLFWSFGR